MGPYYLRSHNQTHSSSMTVGTSRGTGMGGCHDPLASGDSSFSTALPFPFCTAFLLGVLAPLPLVLMGFDWLRVIFFLPDELAAADDGSPGGGLRTDESRDGPAGGSERSEPASMSMMLLCAAAGPSGRAALAMAGAEKCVVPYERVTTRESRVALGVGQGPLGLAGLHSGNVTGSHWSRTDRGRNEA